MRSSSFSSASKENFKILALLSTLLLLVAMLLTACGGATQQNTSKKASLTIGAHVGGDFTKAFSPYNPSPNEGILGMVYETLYFFNRADGTTTPWLATGYKWSSDYKQLIFTTRQNVKWSDGQPFSADDV